MAHIPRNKPFSMAGCEPARPAGPHKRDGVWYLIRRVPKEFAEFDRRGIVRISIHIPVADNPCGIRARDVVRQLAGELTDRDMTP
jgi:hypothetical protein